MLELLFEFFSYDYMFKVIVLSGVIGVVCVFFFFYLMFKGWLLIGDVLLYVVVLGVVLVYVFFLFYVMGVFFFGFFVAFVIFVVKLIIKFKEDVVIGFIFIIFFVLGLFIIFIYLILVDV